MSKGMNPYKYQSAEDPLAWDAVQMLSDSVRSCAGEMQRLNGLAHQMAHILEATRVQYNNAVAERDNAHSRWQVMDSKLSQIESAVRRYAATVDPVVASDGYTYEKEQITTYLKECKDSRTNAYSQQTKEELTDVVVPNVSLYRLVSHLKNVRPTQTPPLSKRSIIPPMPRSAVWATGDEAVPPSAEAAAAPKSLPLSASNARPFDPSVEGKGRKLHPCLRVYGFCNFLNDCTFACYPYEACLNFIKGKCRFGPSCKELHVNPRDPRYVNPRGYTGNNNHGSNNATAPSEEPAAVAGGEVQSAVAEEEKQVGTDVSASPAAAEAVEGGSPSKASEGSEQAKQQSPSTPAAE